MSEAFQKVPYIALMLMGYLCAGGQGYIGSPDPEKQHCLFFGGWGRDVAPSEAGARSVILRLNHLPNCFAMFTSNM